MSAAANIGRRFLNRSPHKSSADFMADLVDELRGRGRGILATDLERCFRYGDTHVNARAAISLIVDAVQ